jgi:hypothetical protein
MAERDFIQMHVDRLNLGQCVTFDGLVFARAFPCGFPSIYNTSVEAFLSRQVGSAWGCIRAEQDPLTGNVTVSRHEEGQHRVYVDPDRAHLYRRDEHGHLVPKWPS